MQLFGFLSFILGPIMKFIYDFVGNYGVAIILFTILVRVVSFPLAVKQQKTTAKMSIYQPIIQEIQTKYKNKPEKMNQEMQRMQEEYGYNPTAGCLPMALNMLILFGVIEVVYYPMQYILGISRDLVTSAFAEISTDTFSYLSTSNVINAAQNGTVFAALSDAQNALIQNFNVSFLGINLCEMPAFDIHNLSLLVFPVLACATMFVSNHITMKASGQQMTGSMKYMPLVMGLVFVSFCFRVPLAFSLYYCISNVLMLAQSLICKKIYDPEKIKAQYEEELAAKRKAKKAKKQVTIQDESGEATVKEVTESELNKLRLARARALDEEKYKDARTTPLTAPAAPAEEKPAPEEKPDTDKNSEEE